LTLYAVNSEVSARIGDTISQEVTLTDAGSALDLTNYDVRMTFTFSTVSGQSNLALTEGSGITINADPTTGKFVYKITDTQSALVAEGVYAFAVKVELAGDEYTKVEGRIWMRPQLVA
jgi:hypothetical protein